jgi:hypothetical protein
LRPPLALPRWSPIIESDLRPTLGAAVARCLEHPSSRSSETRVNCVWETKPILDWRIETSKSTDEEFLQPKIITRTQQEHWRIQQMQHGLDIMKPEVFSIEAERRGILEIGINWNVDMTWHSRNQSHRIQSIFVQGDRLNDVAGLGWTVLQMAAGVITSPPK